MDVNIIHEKEIRKAISLDRRTIAAAESAFIKYASGDVVMPPVMQVLVDEFGGQSCVKAGHMKGDPFFVIKLASLFPRNQLLKLPNSSGLSLIVNAQMGVVDTILFDNGYLTAIRTAAAGAVSAKCLSRSDASSVALIGAGNQARLQLNALSIVRDIQSVSVWSHTDASSQRFAEEMAEALGITVTAVSSAQLAVQQADIIVTTTPSRVPIIQADWVKPGVHITAVGSDAPGKTELAPDLVATANHYICDSYQQCKLLGELGAAYQSGVLDAEPNTVELGDVVTGKHRFQRGSSDISICDLTGLGIQDTEIALLAKSILRPATPSQN